MWASSARQREAGRILRKYKYLRLDPMPPVVKATGLSHREAVIIAMKQWKSYEDNGSPTLPDPYDDSICKRDWEALITESKAIVHQREYRRRSLIAISSNPFYVKAGRPKLPNCFDDHITDVQWDPNVVVHPSSRASSKDSVASSSDVRSTGTPETDSHSLCSTPVPETNTGQWSKGAANHSSGTCTPCAWSWKPRGCVNGSNCEFCHMCGEVEFKAMKRERVPFLKLRKLAWQEAKRQVRAASSRVPVAAPVVPKSAVDCNRTFVWL